MFVQRLSNSFGGTPTGPSISFTADEEYLANIPGPPGGTNALHRWWSGERTFQTPEAVSGLMVWRDRLSPGEVLKSVAGSNYPTKTEAFASRQTITFGGSHELDAPTFNIDADANTVFILVKPGATAGVVHCWGPAISPAFGAPTDDVFSLSWTDGVPRLVGDDGLATVLSGAAAGDLRGAPHLICCTMSTSGGKAIYVDGVLTARNAALTTSLITTSFSLGNFGTTTTNRMRGDVSDLLVIPGQDLSDVYYATAFAAVTDILMARGGL